MRIGEINQQNYTEFLRLFSLTNPRAKKLSQLLSNIPQRTAQAQSCTLGPPGIGEDVTGRTDWKKIVPVPKEVTDKLLANVKEDFTERNGMTGEHNNQNDIINDYLKTLPPEKRPSAGWTCDQVIINEAKRYVNKIRQHYPTWTNGQPFDTSILDDTSSSEHFDKKV